MPKSGLIKLQLLQLPPQLPPPPLRCPTTPQLRRARRHSRRRVRRSRRRQECSHPTHDARWRRRQRRRTAARPRARRYDQICLVKLHCDVPVAPLGCSSALLGLGLESGDETVQLGVIAAEHRSNARRAPCKRQGGVALQSFSKFQ